MRVYFGGGVVQGGPIANFEVISFTSIISSINLTNLISETNILPTS